MNFNFGEVLTRAWQIVWKHKILWIFGILASCSSGNHFNGSGGGRNSGFGNGSDPTARFGYEFARMSDWISNHILIVVAVVIFLMLIALVFLFLGAIGKIALIKGTYKADKGAEKLPFGELFSESQPYFWRVFGLSFLFGLAILVVIAPFILAGFLTRGIGLLCMIPLLCVLIPIIIVVGVVLEQANAAIVLEDLSMIDGFKRGWKISKSNAGAIFIMALILGVGGGIIGFIFAIPMILAVLPIVFGAMFGATPVIIVGAICAVIYLPVIIAFDGVLAAYVQSAWTLTFMRLTAPKIEAPISVEANA